jgi:ATP/maltotriose-dependent transcriptional regulator MalT
MTRPIERLRLRRLVEASSRHRVTLVVAPPGYGKSNVLEDHALRRSAPRIRLSPGTSFARFTGELVRAVAPCAPGMLHSLSGAYERALDQQDGAAALAAWFGRHLAGVACTIAVDDLQNAADPRVVPFVLDAIERSPESVRWLVASRSLDGLPLDSWLAHGTAALPLDEENLRLDRGEARALGERFNPEPGVEAIERFRLMSDAVIGDFVFLIRLPAWARELGVESRDRFETLVERVFASLEAVGRDFMTHTVLLPVLDAQGVSRIVGPSGAQTLATLRKSAPYLFEPDGRRYQSRFAAFLRASLGVPELGREIAARTADALENLGDAAEALRLLVSIGDERAILDVLERHGFAFLEGDYAYVLHDAVDVLSPQARAANPAVLALLAIAAALGGRGDVSESYFQNALKVCATPSQRTQVRLWYGYELVRRGRPDAIDLLSPDPASSQAPVSLRVAMMSGLAAAYASFGSMERARRLIGRALRSLAQVDDALTKSRVYHQASFIALESSQFARAKELATRSLALAEAVGAYEVAAGALSVLYNISADVEENFAQAAEHLRHMALCGSKCGSIDKQLYALVAAYEIEAERGDAEAMRAIERDLSNFDVHYSQWLTNESLLPAQMLQLAWRGEFARANRILSASADQQLDAERRALRYAEIGVYAAAAGSGGAAADALIATHRTAKSAPRGGSCVWRMRLYSALAFVLLGRIRSGARIAATVARELPPRAGRLRSLATAVEAFAHWRAGELDEAELLIALDGLRRHDLGGLARLIEALPPACSEPLAMREKRARSA